MTGSEPLIPKHGGYRKLKSFQVAQLVFDVTVRFCDRYIDTRSRTHDQMVQAARSGRAEHRRRQPGIGHLQEDGAQADQCGSGEPGGAAARLRGLPAPARAAAVASRGPPPAALVDRRCATADDVAAWIHQEHERWPAWTGWTGGPSGRQRISWPPRPPPSSPPMPRWCCSPLPAACWTGRSPLRHGPSRPKVASPSGSTACAPQIVRPALHPRPPRPQSPLRHRSKGAPC